jgi:hypothetical protein
VFDIIGKRRWYFAFSLLITIPGLVFILLTPLTGAKEGLQFTIDYTGGTKWELKFENPNVTPDQIAKVFNDNGLPAAVVVTSDGFFEIKTSPIGLRPPARRRRPSRLRRRVPARTHRRRRPARHRRRPPRHRAPRIAGRQPVATPSPSPSPSPSPTPSASPSPAASASPGASPAPPRAPRRRRPAGTGNTDLPTDGKLGEMVTKLEAALGPIASQGSLTTIGPVVSSDLVNQALVLILVGAWGSCSGSRTGSET